MLTDSMERTEKFQEVYQVACNLFRRGPDWVTFFREVLGTGGIARAAFPDAESMAAFERSKQFDEIQMMLAKLRSAESTSDDTEPTRVITVRLPQSLHESLRAEAKGRATSMNKLCISKLLQLVEDELVPSDKSNGKAKPRKAATAENLSC